MGASLYCVLTHLPPRTAWYLFNRRITFYWRPSFSQLLLHLPLPEQGEDTRVRLLVTCSISDCILGPFKIKHDIKARFCLQPNAYTSTYTFAYDSIDRGINMFFINVRVDNDIPIAISIIKKTTSNVKTGHNFPFSDICFLNKPSSTT